MDNALEARWLTRFLELLAFKKEYGHTNVPDGYEKNRSLAYWIQRQRHLHTIKKIDTLREELLKLAGFQFRILSHHDWEEMFEKLILFKEIYGHVHITEDCEDRQLHDWLVYQRKQIGRAHV